MIRNLSRRLTAAVFIAAAAVLFLFSPCVSAEILFMDNADLYNTGEEALLRQKMTEFTEETGWNIGIVTATNDFYSESSAGTAAEKYYDDAFGADSSGVLYLCDVGYRYIVIAGDARKYIVGPRFSKMLESVNDKYMDYDDMGSADKFISFSEKYYRQGEGSFYIGGENIALALVLFAASVIIIFFIIKHSYSKYPAPSASLYIDNKTVDIYRRMDTFLRQFVTRTSNSSSGGGHGGGGFSGGHHGGGGAGGHR